MKFKFLIVIILFSVLTISSVPSQATNTGSVSTNEVYLPAFSYKTASVSVDGMPNQPGFFNFTVTTPEGSIIWVYWRHNSDDVNVVLQTNQTGFIGVGWKNVAPSNNTVGAIMNNSNIIIGSNDTARDDTGFYDGSQKFDANGLDNIINYTVQTDSSGIRMEFNYPLDDKCPIDANIDIGTYSYMIFATGSEKSLNATFDLTKNAMYVPYVYIGTWMDTGYVAPPSNSTSFGEPWLLVLALLSLPVVKKMRKR